MLTDTQREALEDRAAAWFGRIDRILSSGAITFLVLLVLLQVLKAIAR